MIRFIVVALFLLATLTGNCFSNSDKKPPIEGSFFDGYYATFIDHCSGEIPYFINETTGDRLYIGKDIPLGDLIGYRFKKLQFGARKPCAIDVIHTAVVNENSRLSNLFVATGTEPDIDTRLCVYAPDDTLIGQQCTDRYYGHTHYPESSKPENYYYDFDKDFHVTWVTDKADSRQLPFFRNAHTDTNWYLDRDLPVSALNGYHLRVRGINMHGTISKRGLDIKIDENTTINDLRFKLSEFGGRGNNIRICLYNPQGKPIGNNNSCTDTVYHHNYCPYRTEPADYAYCGKTTETVSPKQDFSYDSGIKRFSKRSG